MDSEHFSYDEIVSLINRKHAFWLRKLHQLDSDAIDELKVLSAYVAACNYIIRDVAIMASDKQREKLEKLNGPSGAKPETM